MTQRSIETLRASAEQIEAYIARPSKTLAFDRDLEARFRTHDVEARAQHAYWAGMIAILAYNVLTTLNALQHRILATAETRILLASLSTVTIPSVGFLAIVRNSRDPRLNELLLATGYVFVTLGAVLVNRAMTRYLSIGLASLNPALPEDAASLLRRADAALYRAKHAGRDRAEVDLRIVGA